MPQTLLAFLAVILVTTYSFNMAQYEIMVQQEDITREVEEMAGSVAIETMEVVRARAFDQAEVDGTLEGATNPLSQMTFYGSSEHFPTNGNCSVFGTGATNCDDIDDFHKMQTANRPFVMGLDTVMFNVDIEVIYVDGSLTKAATATYRKEVTVKVKDVWGAGMKPFLNTPIELKRVFTYAF